MSIPLIDQWKSSNYRERHGKCCRGKQYWLEYTLQEAVKDQELESFDVPIAAIPLDYQPWDLSSIEEICYHFNRVQEVSEDFPLILDENGCLRDGHHRLVKAMISGKKTVKCYRLQSMPPPDGYSDNED